MLTKLMVFYAIVLTTSAFASGKHAGGHGHANDESAIGKPGVAAQAQRSITVAMTDDMRFTPAVIKVKRNETVRLAVRNDGKIRHELSLGTQKELLEHLEEMKKFPGMEHDEPGKITLEPGQQGEIVWQFTKAGVVHFACLIPGHYESGMKGTIAVGKK